MQQPIEPLASQEILPPNINDYVKNKILIRLKRGDLEDTKGSSLQNKNEYVTGKIGKIGNDFIFYDNASYTYITNLKNIKPLIPTSEFLFPSEPSDSEPSDGELSGGYKRNKIKKSKKFKKSKKNKKNKKSKKKKKGLAFCFIFL